MAQSGSQPEVVAVRLPVSGMEALVVAMVITAIVASRWHGYLLFHTLVELVGICVVLTAFSLAWNTRHHLEDDFLRLAGMSLGPSAVIALLHTLTYKGLGVFAVSDSNLPTQLWVAMRVVQVGALFAATLPVVWQWKSSKVLSISAATSVLLVTLIFVGVFPDCHVDGRLTPFKLFMELACMVGSAVAAIRISRDHFPRHPLIRKLLIAALIFGVAESAAFSLYVDVYGAFNMVGHLLALLQMLLLYSAITWVGLTIPLESLYARQSERSHRFEQDAVRAQDDILRFAEILAHHLQEPVRQQHVFTQALVKALPRPLPAEAEQALCDVMGGAIRQRALLRDALRYLSLAEPAAELQVCRAEIALMAACRHLAEAITAANAHVRYDKLPAVAVGKERLVDLFLALLDNALKYHNPNVAPEIEISASRQGGMVHFILSDNGPGIAPEFRLRVFAIFERLSSDEHTDRTGIGLAIAKRVVDMAGGHIWIDSGEKGGTRMHFTLPAAA